MFTYNPTAPTSMRYAALDLDDETARRIMRRARRVAVLRHEGKDYGMARHELRQAMWDLDMDHLNTLAVMHMIVRPNVHAMRWTYEGRHEVAR